MTQQPPAPGLTRAPAKITLTAAMIDEAPTPRALLDLPAIEQNWVQTYEKISGKPDGSARFGAEKILFLQAVAGNNSLAKADKFSIYSAFTELAISGLTLRDGLSYIVPFKGKAQFLPGWRGRLEQINELPNCVHCHEPQVVYDCDEFQYTLGERTTIQQHKRGQRTDSTKITHVYFVIDFKEGAQVYIMEARDVYNIRDQYSSAYKSYLQLATRQGKKPGDPGIKAMYQNEVKEYDAEIPMWVSDEAQAFKKTIVKRVYGVLPKLPKQKYLDERLTSALIKMQASKEDLEENIKGEDFSNYFITNGNGDDTRNNNDGGDPGGVITAGAPAGGGAVVDAPPPPVAAAKPATTGPAVIPPATPPPAPAAAAAVVDQDLAALAANTNEGF